MQAVTQPVGTIAVKVIGIPAGSPTGSQLSWTFNGFIANATSSSTTATVNVTQVLSADENVTDSADPAPTTALSKVYGLDYDPYILSALNETGTLDWLVKVRFNVTLGNHYIPQESWITSIKIEVAGNSSLLPSIVADINLYNYTGAVWLDIGDLNSTTRTTVTYTLTSNIAQFIDENANNKLQLRIYLEDGSNTDFTLHIDYIAVTVTYQFDITVGSWATTQADSTVTVGTPANYDVNYWENCTLSAPSGITDHNFTVYIDPPDKTSLTSHAVYVNGTSVTVSVSSGQVSFNVTNLVANSTDLKFVANDIITVSIPSVHVATGESEYYETITWKFYKTTVRVKNNYAELTAENVTLKLQDWTATVFAEIHQESEIDLVELTRNGTDITASLTTKTLSLYQTPQINISPANMYEYVLTEALPPVHFIDTDGLTLSNVKFQGGINRLKFDATGTGSKTIVIYIESTPFGVYVDGSKYDDWTWKDNNLTINYNFGSTHTFEIYQFNPNPKKEEAAPTVTEEEKAPTVTVQPVTAEIIPTWLWLSIILVGAVLIMYMFRCALFGICKRG